MAMYVSTGRKPPEARRRQMAKAKEIVTAGRGVNFADPKSDLEPGQQSCVQCGRTVGNDPWYVECINGGSEIRIQTGVPYELCSDYDPSSYMGCWPVGNECAKSFAPNLLFKMKKEAK